MVREALDGRSRLRWSRISRCSPHARQAWRSYAVGLKETRSLVLSGEGGMQDDASYRCRSFQPAASHSQIVVDIWLKTAQA